MKASRKMLSVAARCWLLTASTVVFAGPSYGQTFWQGTTYGDALEKVQAKIPDAMSTGKKTDEERKKTGFVEMATSMTTLAGVPFRVFFYFKSDGLNRVILRRDAITNEAEARETFSVLVQALRSKYGRVTNSEDLDAVRREDRAMWFTWASVDTDIILIRQHQGHPTTIGYTLSDRGDERAAKTRAKKLDPKAEAGKL